MIRLNENYLKLQSSYLFSEIARRVALFQKENPGKEIIRLGIGDVTRALPRACIEAFHKATDEMANDATFRGYGPEQGYDFLREAIARERRRQMRHRQYPGAFCRRHQNSHSRPSLSGLYRHECHGGPHWKL